MTEPSAIAWLAALERRETSSAELVARTLSRIDSVNPALNAAVSIDRDRAGIEAEAADRRRAAGESLPLLGLPVTIKDSLATAGLRTTCGSLVRGDVVPEQDATVVARLRAAGAIVVAKTNVPEYQWRYETDNVLFGRTVNPLDSERTPGGSSGGEAALLGADASLVGIGTDGGGSIRVPAQYCGVVGLRPTAGLVPETGVWPPTRATGMMDMLCVGPMARRVEDLWLLLQVLAGGDGIDPYVAPGANADAAPRDGRLTVGWYTDDGALEPSRAARTGLAKAVAALAERGHRVVEAPPPDVGEATDIFFNMMAADGGARARADLTSAGEEVHPSMARLLERLRGNALDAAAYFDLVRRAFALRARMRAYVGRQDVVICPVTSGVAPPHGSRPGTTTGADRFNAVHTQAVAGLPSVSVPVDVDGGMPIGVQVVAQAFRDRTALAVASQLEEDLGGFDVVAAPRRDPVGPTGPH